MFFFFTYKKNKWASILVLLHIVSVASGPLLDYQMEFSLSGLAWTIVICFYIYLIVEPWSCFRISSAIQNNYGRKFKYFSSVLITLGVLAFFCFIPIIILLYSLDLDPNEFKYQGGVDDFLALPSFPIPPKLLTLVTYSAYVSILALPLHFYYLSVKNNKMAFWSLIASLAYVLRGLTYFSRALPISFMMMYVMFFILFRESIDKKIISILKKGALIVSVLLVINILSISTKRFSDKYDFYQTEYSQNKEIIIKDPVIVSYLDYLCQGYYNCYDLLNKYDGKTFGGNISFQDILILTNQYLGIGYSRDKIMDLRRKIWPGAWSATFNSYVAYVVYDFGIIGSLLITLLYSTYVRRKCRLMKKGKLLLSDLNWIMLLFQIPLFSIFYSALGALVIPGIFLIVLNIVFKPRNHKIYFKPVLQ